MQEIIQFIRNHSMLSLVWVILLGIVIFTNCKNWFSKLSEIACSEAIHLINKENAVIIDLRDKDDYCNGHIVNSLNLSAVKIKSGNLYELEKNKYIPIIFVCANGSTSRDPAQTLLKAGFERVYVLKEGISGWSRGNLPLVQSK